MHAAYPTLPCLPQVQQRLGYCPQFDALIDQMTVKETLRMYARLRGVTEGDIFPLVDALIEQLLLHDHADKQAGTLRWFRIVLCHLNLSLCFVGNYRYIHHEAEIYPRVKLLCFVSVAVTSGS